MMRQAMVRMGAVLAVAGAAIVFVPLWGSDGALTILGGAAMLVAGVVLLSGGLLASRRGWAFLALVGACVYGLALMLPHAGQHGGIERACASWLDEEAPPEVRAAIEVNPNAGWANGPTDIGTSYLPAGRVCTFTPPGMAPVRLTPSWTMTLVAASCVAVCALGAGLTRSFARGRDAMRP